jgi:hypothetical protein
MSWADSVKATALAALAERTTTVPRLAVDTPWSWNAHDVWLTHIRQPRELAARSSMSEPSTAPRPDIAARLESTLVPPTDRRHAKS